MGERCGQGEEMMLAAPDRGREDAIIRQRKREASAAGCRRNNREGWGSNDAREIGVDLVLVLVQHGDSRFRRGRGALDAFHDRGGRGKTRELSAEEVATAVEETATGTSNAMGLAISQKYLAKESMTAQKKRCHKMRITWSNCSSTAEEGDDGEDGRPGHQTSEGYHQ
ncbi:hypothetical protein B296_00050511 [Ensete ventricosum]|uniref:Uncharacterized protein n=1 Tax=Ensete ventricosum TaxID=4639 RepID=A0A426YE40_ENSVE|nr:hypothetical protein B296_00050511 [Ensete ventricosum]